MYWTLQNLKDSENKQEILHFGSIFSAATVYICSQAAYTTTADWYANCSHSVEKRDVLVAFVGHNVTQIVMQVPDLVATRKVVLHKGMAYVPSDLLCSVVTAAFRESMSKALLSTAGRWATSIVNTEAQRLAPVVRCLSTRCALLRSFVT
jgi:DNA primase large subunit